MFFFKQNKELYDRVMIHDEQIGHLITDFIRIEQKLNILLATREAMPYGSKKDGTPRAKPGRKTS